MIKGDKCMALLGGKWETAVYEKELSLRGREGQHLVVVGKHNAIARSVKESK